MLGSLRMREAHLPAPVAEDEQDRDGVLQVALVHRGEGAGRVLALPRLLALQDLANAVPDVGVVDAEEVPGLGVGAARRPPPRLHDREQRLARDPPPRLELPHAPAAPDDVEQGRCPSARLGREVVPFGQRSHLPVAPCLVDATERSPVPTAPPTSCTRRLEDTRGPEPRPAGTTLAACRACGSAVLVRSARGRTAAADADPRQLAHRVEGGSGAGRHSLPTERPVIRPCRPRSARPSICVT